MFFLTRLFDNVGTMTCLKCEHVAIRCFWTSRESSGVRSNGLRGFHSGSPGPARSSVPQLSAQPLQSAWTMGDGLQAGSSQNPPSAPRPLPFNPPAPETWNPSRPKRQTNQLHVKNRLPVFTWDFLCIFFKFDSIQFD